VPVSPKTCRQPRICTPRGAGRGSPGGEGWRRRIGTHSAQSPLLRRRLCILSIRATPPARDGRRCARCVEDAMNIDSDTPAAAPASAPVAAGPAMDTARPTRPVVGAAPGAAGDEAIPAPRASALRAHQDSAGDVATWITKEAGNRRLPYERARLERSIDRVHAEFPQLDIVDYKRSVFGFVERKDAVNADDLVDHLVREAEARVDVAAPEWEMFAARIYLHRLYKRASRNRFYDAAEKYGSYVGLQESLADRNIYSNDILRAYSKEELIEA